LLNLYHAIARGNDSSLESIHVLFADDSRFKADKAPCKNTFGGRQSKDLFKLNKFPVSKLVAKRRTRSVTKRNGIRYSTVHSRRQVTLVVEKYE
jgi:hypothetical protein